MAEEIDSLEQSERARKWMQQNGSAILIGVLAAVALLMGYEAWKGRRVVHRGEAGDHYVELSTALAASQADRTRALIGTLGNDFKDTGYAALARLEGARLAVGENQLDEAIGHARAALDAARTEPLKEIARLRLARLLLVAGKPAEALEQLGRYAPASKTPVAPAAGFQLLASELRGDALLATGKSSEALSAYELALAGMDVNAPGRSGLQMKIDDLKSGS